MTLLHIWQSTRKPSSKIETLMRKIFMAIVKLFVVLVFLSSFSFCDLYLGTVNSTNSAGCGLSATFPCATLQYLMRRCTNGDTIIIQEGTYYSQPSVTVTCENIQILAKGIFHLKQLHRILLE